MISTRNLHLLGSIEKIKSLYKHEALTDAIIAGLNPEISLKDLEKDLFEIGCTPSHPNMG